MSARPSLPRLASASSVADAFPRTAEAFASMPDGDMWLERLIELDSNWDRLRKPPQAVLSREEVAGPTTFEADVAIAGGCFGLIVGATLASRFGWKVIVFDRHLVGKTHRDWNISRAELRRLSEAGLFGESEMDSFIVNEYDGGFVKFHDEDCGRKGPTMWFEDVLTVAVSSDKLLERCRRKLEDSGTGSFLLDGATMRRVSRTNDAAFIELEHKTEGRQVIRAKLLLDVTGTLSPIARQLNPSETVSYVCPTVGTLASNFATGKNADEVDERKGEILVSNEHIRDGRQLLWEGFAGKPGEFTTYLFYYTSVDSPTDKSLLKLYEEYFDKLPEYKRAGSGFSFDRPVFGYIPGVHHLGWGPQKKTADERVLLLGDAASMNSPLTFCGFGSLVRNIRRITHLIDLALKGNHLDARSLGHITAYEPRVAIMATFTRFMIAEADDRPTAVNELLNVMLEALEGMPESARRGLFQDQMQWSDFVRLLLTMQTMHPRIWEAVPRKLGFNYGLAWLLNFAEFSAHSLQSTLGGLMKLPETPPKTEFHEFVNYYRYATA